MVCGSGDDGQVGVWGSLLFAVVLWTGVWAGDGIWSEGTRVSYVSL